MASEQDRVIVSSIERLGIRYAVVLDSRAFRDYRVGSIPEAVLVGRDGKVLFRGHPADLSDAAIEAWLARPAGPPPEPASRQD